MSSHSIFKVTIKDNGKIKLKGRIVLNDGKLKLKGRIVVNGNRDSEKIVGIIPPPPC